MTQTANLTKYHGAFTSWKDVQAQFNMTMKAPRGLIYAGYDREDYEGTALVVWTKGKSVFTVRAGHCSCYGLEDQWDPEEYDTMKLFKDYVRGAPHYMPDEVRAAIGLPPISF